MDEIDTLEKRFEAHLERNSCRSITKGDHWHYLEQLLNEQK